ncbi:exocyst complex component exo84 [Taxawa tesnikishii (nom. ined.)]|nr:exocyst complex component exo84 [Dothideales sp. JES 119]
MRTLRTLMSELTGALSHATSAGGSESTSNSVDQKRRNRTSVANLEALWSTHLQTLWKRVEGSQKFLPAIPGRHIVHESSRWVELNAATWKPRRRVHLILLNDHFLVASEKKRMELPAMGNSPNAKRQSIYQAPAQTQLVAERCWPLNDVQMTDISSRSGSALGHRDGGRDNIANGINVRVGTESWTFATTSSSADSSNEKAALLVALRKAVEDLRKNQAAQNGERERALDELAFLTGRDPKLLQAGSGGVEGAGNVNDAGIPNRSSTLIDVDGRQQSLRWVESQIDALDIGIALQHFEEAVSRTEKLRKLAKGIKGNAVAQEVVLAKLNDRASKLAVTLGRRLGEGSQGLDRTKESVGWLVRLGYEEMARVSYLEARRETLRKRVRQLPFTGSLPPHLLALSYVTFTIILHTIRTFTSSFPAASSSAVVKWAKERVDEFNESLERQMSSVEQGSPLWDECAGVVRSQSEVLQEVGVDFGGLVASGLFEERQEEMVQEARPRERREGSRRLQADGQREKQREPVGLGLS